MNEFSRNKFLKAGFKVGAGLTCLTNFSGTLLGNRRNSRDEIVKKKLAKYIFNFASPYFSSDEKMTPHAHSAIKELIEKHTNNKIYVEIHDGGAKGIGSELAKKVKLGEVQGALLSVANLAPMMKQVDILNIPYWAANTEPYTKVFSSQIFYKHVLNDSKKYGIEILFPFIIGKRTASTTKKYGELIKSPYDFINVIFRIPGSESLKNFYKLALAIPISVPWKLAAASARANKIEGLD